VIVGETVKDNKLIDWMVLRIYHAIDMAICMLLTAGIIEFNAFLEGEGESSKLRSGFRSCSRVSSGSYDCVIIQMRVRVSRATIIVISSMLRESWYGFDFVFSFDYIEVYLVLHV
jgi:hypothetical protein